MKPLNVTVTVPEMEEVISLKLLSVSQFVSFNVCHLKDFSEKI